MRLLLWLLEILLWIGRAILRLLSGTANIFFLDAPSLIDSTWRHFDHVANAEHDYVPESPKVPERDGPASPQTPAHLTPRPFWRTPPFWFFALIVFSVAWGPTGSSLCSVAPQLAVRIGLIILALMISSAVLWFVVSHRGGPGHLVARRFERIGKPGASVRRTLVTLGAYLSLAVPVLFIGGVWTFFLTWPDCTGTTYAPVSLVSLVLCVVVIGVVGVIGSRLTCQQTIFRGRQRGAPCTRLTIRLVYLQVAAIVGVELIHSLYLSEAGVREADHLPYRHLFLFWAPAVALVLIAAPFAACFMFRKQLLVAWSFEKTRKIFKRADAGQASKPPANPDSIQVEAAKFQEWLKDTELFEYRAEPILSARRLFFALIYGPVYHLLHLMLLPGLVGLVVEAKWLYAFVTFAFLLSMLLLMWGYVSARWNEMNVQIERWFLRGGPLFVSVAVIIIATLRVMQVDYISTVLDALPFGTIFGGVAMTYVLFWFMEYWLNRIVAVKLLGLIGEGKDELSIVYPRNGPPPDGIDVSTKGRFIALQGTGRFVALGAPSGLDKPARFNSFGFLPLFVQLGERGKTAEEADYAKDFERRLANYFFILNLAMLAITGWFTWHYAQSHLFAANGMDPLLETRSKVPPAKPVDLADLLVSKDGQTSPAIVVVGSGGGTRAALYTASVLRGLHGIGVDKDIVLLSGVSGGGVALAYFAANRDGLVTAPQREDAPTELPNPPGLLDWIIRTFVGRVKSPTTCPDDAIPGSARGRLWDCFDERMTEPFIEDVLNGATEWRQFETTALSNLLAESFDRRLFKGRKLASLTGPGLILNAAVASYPADASALLKGTLDDLPKNVSQDDKCGEAERTFQLLSGGRMVFTNLKDTTRFPQAKERIPDVRLPYGIVRGDDTPLATAAALNANFPPVFPNARVRILDAENSDCPARSYYVTDGGTVENLGLLSALYALQSAIANMPKDQALRPIHIVLAEASAVDYDYGQDRGLSTVSGSRERLAGGLTEVLIDDLEHSEARPKLEFHYLGLPMVFRARGGFGTHWMYAEQYRLSDPRPRHIASKHYIRDALFGDGRVAVGHEALRELWRALHNPDKQLDFCHAKFEKPNIKTVQGWICGDCKVHRAGQDLHMGEWKRLLDQLAPKLPGSPEQKCGG